MSNSYILIIGAPQTGKSHFVKRLIEEKENMFWPNIPTQCIFHYSQYQDLYSNISCDNILFQKGIPSEKEIENLVQCDKHTLLIIDDLLPDLYKSKYVENLLTTSLRHARGGISLVVIGHNIFQKARSHTLSLCTSYHVLFPNLRDKAQVMYLAREAFPGNVKVFKEACSEALDKDITGNQFPYLVVDYKFNSDPDYRLRTNIFLNDVPMFWKPL